MAQFSYKARRRSGEIVQGVLDGNDRGAVLVQIERLGLLPVSLEAASGSITAKDTAGKNNSGGRAVSLPPFLRSLLNRKRKPKLQELATYTQQLANLLRSGMPLAVALNSMSHLEAKGISQEVSKQLRQDVMEGKSLSESMSKQPHIFSEFYINMVKAGEQSGAIEEVLRRLAVHFERFAEVQQKFISALTYPAVVAGVGVTIITLFMTVILPKFTALFTEMNVPLPTSTQMLISISDFFTTWWWAIPLACVPAVIFYRRFAATELGRRSIDKWKISLPVLGKVTKLNLFGQFARTLSTLLHNGVPVLTALQITEKVIPNVILRQAIEQTREGVTDGKTLAQPLARSRVFPQLMIDLIKIGEETGDVPGSLQSVAETYENELTIALRIMTNLIEPAMIILMAVGVGGLLYSILSALFQITSSINPG